MFSVSQICDKKNNVLFTDTECLVLSSDFKLLDESQVLLRVPRKDNIYSVELKSIVPTKGLTCLFAKAIIDESNLWHRRLGHINFKNINKLVKGNLNGIAERKNRTLIEAARTMLVDSNLPTTFWTEAVNTACYGQAERSKNPESVNPEPLCTTDLLISQDPKVSEEDAEEKHIGMDKSRASDKDGKDEQATRSDTPVSTAGPCCTDDNPSSIVNAAEASNAIEEHLFEQFYPFKNAFTLPPVSNVTPMDDTGIFSNAYDDEDVGVEADLNNLETTMNVSPIPTTRIDKDHPKDQIIGGFNSAIQTRRMTKITDEHAMNRSRRGINNVCQPPGFEDPHFPDKVYKVEKALYGLHQAPRAWYATLSTYLIKNGFRRGTLDKTLFIKKDKGDILLIHVYVDDIIFGSTKKSLCDEFEGLQVQQKEDGIFIRQDKYMAGILKKFDFSTVKIASTPIETNKELVKHEEAEAVDVHLYRSMIGSLMYLTASRPDIKFDVCACARFQVTPKMSHIQAVKRIFRYLKGQPILGIWYPRDSPFNLEAFSDSDYAGASLDRKFKTGAEYVAAANCCGQVLWIQNQMLDYGFNFMNTKIYIDNESTIYKTAYKEWEDRMERAATTASSLEAEQDSGNINRTQSMATLNEPLPQGTGSGSGPSWLSPLAGCKDLFSLGLSSDIRAYEIPPPPPSQTPTQQTPHTVSTIKLPILKKGEYDIWAMKMEHYLAHTDYPIWEVIQNGNGPVSITTDTQEDHLAKFHKMTDAKEMWEAIKSRFGGNDESKKMQKYILKQQFEGFFVSNSEGLHKGYDKFQSLLSQLEIHGADVSTEDANQKFLRSLPSAGPQNVAFVSENTSSTNDVSTAYGVSNPSSHNSQYEQTSSYSLLANQSSCPYSGSDTEREQLSDAGIEIKAYTQGQKKVEAQINYEFNSEDSMSSNQQKTRTPSLLRKQVKTHRETVRIQFTHSKNPKVDNKGLGYGFITKACFICGSLSHLIRDCDFHEKRMAKQAELNNRMSKKSSQREIRPIWNNVQRVNNKNQFVPTAVLTRTGKIPVNTARASGTNNVSTARHNFNSQAVLTNAARKISTVKPVVNRVRPKTVFHKTHSPFSRPFNNTTALRTNFSYQKVNTAEVNAVSAVGGKRETAVKPQQVVIGDQKDITGTKSPNTIDYPHRTLQNKGIVDRDVSRHILATRPNLAEYQTLMVPCCFLEHFSISISFCVTICAQEEQGLLCTANMVFLFFNSQEVKTKDAGEAPNKHLDLKTDEKPVDKEDQVFLDELERLKRQKKDVNDAAEALKKEFAQETEELLLQAGAANTSNDLEIPVLEDIYKNPTDGIFTNSSYDDEGAVADFTNLEPVVNVSPIPTSRINSIHPSTLILGDLQSAVQTRRRIAAVQDLESLDSCRFALWEEGNWNKIGFIDPKYPKKVYKVVKALYGLHQAPRAWYDTLSTFLLKNGYIRGTIDKTLFIKKDKHDIILVQVYVDDIIFGSTKKSWCDEFEALMKSRFQMSSMGELTFFLGLQVKQKEDGIFISQDKYVAEILKKFDFISVKTTSTPIETQKPLVKDEEASDVDVHLYRSMIGSLMYLTASRPNIMFAVCVCSRFQVTLKTSHLSAVKRIFRYLKGKPKLGLWYPRVSLFDLEAYSDCDYARANLNRKSTIGEAEYVAAANCCGQVL
ncbi:putative ribonuclease H-like domain-containing protein [Tanacetum coccineum]